MREQRGEPQFDRGGWQVPYELQSHIPRGEKVLWWSTPEVWQWSQGDFARLVLGVLFAACIFFISYFGFPMFRDIKNINNFNIPGPAGQSGNFLLVLSAVIALILPISGFLMERNAKKGSTKYIITEKAAYIVNAYVGRFGFSPVKKYYRFPLDEGFACEIRRAWGITHLILARERSTQREMAWLFWDPWLEIGILDCPDAMAAKEILEEACQAALASRKQPVPSTPVSGVKGGLSSENEAPSGENTVSPKSPRAEVPRMFTPELRNEVNTRGEIDIPKPKWYPIIVRPFRSLSGYWVKGPTIPDSEEGFQEMLESGEELLWMGKASQKGFRWAIWLQSLLFIPSLCFLVFICYGWCQFLSGQPMRNVPKDSWLPIFPLSLMTIMGASGSWLFLFGAHTIRSLTSRATYLITNRRLLILHGFGNYIEPVRATVIEFGPEEIARRQLGNCLGKPAIILTGESVNHKAKIYWLVEGILLCPTWHEAETILRERFDQAIPEAASPQPFGLGRVHGPNRRDPFLGGK